ncbi:MAG: DUF2723 domain-containing protein [Candidatus Auribacterota bacterium]
MFAFISNKLRLPYVLLAVLLFSVYCYTLLPGIGYSGDTIKFQYAGWSLGVPHQPGYPLYVMLTWLFTHLFPFGSIAYRANLFSAVCAVFSCLILMKILAEIISVRMKTAFFISLIFGVTLTFWSQSVIAEVYTLNILFLGGVLYFFLRWNATRKEVFFYAGCVVYGLSFSHHPLMITVLPALVYLVLVSDRSILLKPGTVFVTALSILCGLLPYAYLPWRYYASAPYLETAVTDFYSFWNCITGKGFEQRMFRFSPAMILFCRIPLFVFYFVREYHILLPVIACGIAVLRNRLRITVFLLLACAGNIFFAINYDIRDIFIYPLMSYFILAIFCGAGMDDILRRLRIISRPLVSAGVYMAIAACFIWLNYPVASQRNNTRDAEATKQILSLIHGNAIISPVGYFTSNCLNYYLVGYDLTAKRNIHMTYNYFDPAGLYNYVRNGVPLTVGMANNTYTVQPGLRVFCVFDYHDSNSAFIQAGYGRIQTICGALKRFLPDSINIPDFKDEAESLFRNQRRKKELQLMQETNLNATRVTDCVYQLQ